MARTKQTSRTPRRLRDFIIPQKTSKRCRICSKGEDSCQLAQCQGTCKKLFCKDCLDLENNVPSDEVFCTECHPAEYEVESISGVKLNNEPREFLVKFKNYKTSSWIEEPDMENSVSQVNRFIRRYNLTRPPIPLCVLEEGNEVGYVDEPVKIVKDTFVNIYI